MAKKPHLNDNFSKVVCNFAVLEAPCESWKPGLSKDFFNFVIRFFSYFWQNFEVAELKPPDKCKHHGVLNVEERAGKMIFDNFFSGVAGCIAILRPLLES
jgi:hypothetical protein